MENESTIQNQMQLPNATGVLVMGILSIVCFCCLAAGVIGITLGILALVLGNKAIKMYQENPQLYTEASFKNAKAGKVCGIIGLSIGSIWLIGVLIYLSIVGWVVGSIFTTLPWNMFCQ
ncbi:MAG: CCC motif membrane protein [Salinivirgaceae bacterium]